MEVDVWMIALTSLKPGLIQNSEGEARRDAIPYAPVGAYSLSGERGPLLRRVCLSGAQGGVRVKRKIAVARETKFLCN